MIDARRLTSRTLTRATLAALGVLFVVCSATAIGAVLTINRSGHDARVSGEIAAAYLSAQDALSREDEAEDAYKREPDPALRKQFERTAVQMRAALTRIQRADAAPDRALARRTRSVHEVYVSATREIFDAADRHDAKRMDEIDRERADAAKDELRLLVSVDGPGHAIEALGDLDRLGGTTHRVTTLTAVAVPIAALICLLIGLVFGAFRRRLEEAARDELERTREQARTDELTGLANRRGFSDAADAVLAEADAAGETAALLLVDLDRFKEINDALGHTAGDELLCQLGRRLEAAIPEVRSIARLGGDEFVVVLGPGTSERGAMTAADRVVAAVDEPFALAGLRAHVRASIGVAASDGATDRAALLRHADAAMYRAKASGRGAMLFAAEVADGSAENVRLAGELRAAVDTEELVLHYQPKAELASGQVTAVEALIRWQHPRLGLLAPAAFLAIAEQHGLMSRITARVLGLACSQAVAWRDAGCRLRVAVNVSPSNLLDAGFPSVVAGALERSGLDPELLQLEITEDTVLRDPVRVLDVVARVSELGVTFALDDFGTGYSSLAYLKQLPINELKIDRSFVSNMETSADDEVIVRSTVELARGLGLRVTAEGVESQASWDRLASFGCDNVQGFLLSRPLPPEEFATWLAALPAGDEFLRAGRSLLT